LEEDKCPKKLTLSVAASLGTAAYDHRDYTARHIRFCERTVEQNKTSSLAMMKSGQTRRSAH
jgi:hypothetical protein